MPHITITLLEGKTQQTIESLSSAIHAAMVETINCPPTALYHIVHQVKREQLFYLPEYNGMKRSDNIIMLQITLKEGRTTEQKKAMYREISYALQTNFGYRPEDIIIIATENTSEDWHLGNAG